MYHPHIVIIGAGIIGLSTALALLKQGQKHITVLEQAQVDHRRAASHGPSRLLRYEYGADRLLTEMVHLSLQRWKDLEQSTQKTLYTPTGALTLGRENDGVTRASYHVLHEAGLTPKRLTQHECKQRFPQFQTQDYDLLFYNAEAGILHASTCLQTLRDCILDLGGTIQEECQVVRITSTSRNSPLRLSLKNGEEVTAEQVVLATGPWVQYLLGELQLPIRLTRQYSLYFAHLEQSSFGLYAFPAFMADDLYGFPILNISPGKGPQWLKAASHRFGSATEPDAEPAIDERVIEQTRWELCQLIPGLHKAELAHIDSCIYDVSPDEMFILDHVPDNPRIIFATGLSGHGFKFGLLLGEMLSGLLRASEPVVPLEPFRLARFIQPAIQAHPGTYAEVGDQMHRTCSCSPST